MNRQLSVGNMVYGHNGTFLGTIVHIMPDNYIVIRCDGMEITMRKADVYLPWEVCQSDVGI